MNRDKSYYPGDRFVQPDNKKAFENPYDVSSEVLQDMVARGLKPFVVIRNQLNTASVNPKNTTVGYTAPTAGDWIEYAVPGNHINLLGSDNSSNQAVNTTVFMELWLGPNPPTNDDVGFPLKHNRGFSGPFERFWVRWPAQNGSPNTYGRLVVFRYQYRPWISGENAT